ncbi:hypothetical protein GCM10018779_05390 [Streptomyces griseocarneus]|nr:hypothetical protein GCM10018779_05390 [Streptomyces griseocarneus]
MQIALDLPPWAPLLALTGTARLWEPHRLRLRLFSAAVQLVTIARRRYLGFHHAWPLDRRDHSSDQPARRAAQPRLSNGFTRPGNLIHLPEPWNPAPTRRDSRATSLPGLRNSPPPPVTKRQSAS